MATRTISKNVVFVSYRTQKNGGGVAYPGDELDLSLLADGEEQRLEDAGGFADTPLPLTRRGTDNDGHSTVDDREPTDTETPVPPENGGVLPLDDETSDYESWDKPALEQEVSDRQASGRDITVEGSGKDGNVVKGDLVTALAADDEAP